MQIAPLHTLQKLQIISANVVWDGVNQVWELHLNVDGLIFQPEITGGRNKGNIKKYATINHALRDAHRANAPVVNIDMTVTTVDALNGSFCRTQKKGQRTTGLRGFKNVDYSTSERC